MKRTGAMLLVLLVFLFPCGLSERALSVGGKEISTGEADAYMYMVRAEYAEICDYYQRCLGIDFWSLTYPNGLSVWQSVQSDAFKQLVMMDAMCVKADEMGLKLEEEEIASLREQAARRCADIENPSFTADDMYSIFEKNLLSRKAYSMLVSMTDVDEEAVRAGVNAGDYEALRVEYLCAPYYLYEDGAEEKEQLKRRLENLSGFEGSWKEAVNAAGTLDAGYLVLSRDEIKEDPSMKELETMAQGEVSGVIETETGLFVFRVAECECSELYDAKVEEALWQAREKAFSAEYERMFHECEYELNKAYWDALKP